MRSLAVAAVAAGGLAAQSFTINFNDGGASHLRVAARDTTVSFTDQQDHLFPLSLPYSGSQTASQGRSSSTAEYVFQQDGFTVSTSTLRPSFVNSHATLDSRLFFSVDADTHYSFTGSYAVDDPDTTGEHVGLQGTLVDVDTDQVLFHNYQVSRGLADAHLVLGESGGNFSNELEGSPDGILLAGHRYSVLFYTSSYTSDERSWASGSGAFEFRLGATSVPEGGSVAAQLALGVAALACAGRRAAQGRWTR